MTYILKAFTSERLSEVRQEWLQLAGDDEFEVELAGPLDWCREHLLPQEGDSHAMELHNEDAGTCDAFLEIVDSRRGTLTKLLKLYVSPAYWEPDEDQEREKQVVELHAQAYMQVIRAGMVKGVRTVKIYGRTDRMYRLLSLLQAKWFGDLIGWDAVMEGRWLNITNRNGEGRL